MKIKGLLILLLCLVMLNGKAQKFNGGLILGLSGSQVAGDGYSGYNKLGFMGGGFVNFQLLNLLNLQMEIEYVQKGSRHNPDAGIGDLSSYKLNLDYVEVPLLLKFGFLKLFKLELGVATSFLVNSYEEINGNSISSRPFQSTNYSTIVGLSYSFSKKFTASFRTSDSFTSIRKTTNTGDVYRYFSWGQWHDMLTLSLQYQFK